MFINTLKFQKLKVCFNQARVEVNCYDCCYFTVDSDRSINKSCSQFNFLALFSTADATYCTIATLTEPDFNPNKYNPLDPHYSDEIHHINSRLMHLNRQNRINFIIRMRSFNANISSRLDWFDLLTCDCVSFSIILIIGSSLILCSLTWNGGGVDEIFRVLPGKDADACELSSFWIISDNCCDCWLEGFSSLWFFNFALFTSSDAFDRADSGIGLPSVVGVNFFKRLICDFVSMPCLLRLCCVKW